MNEKNHFDIILVHTYGKLTSYYINIIKALSKEFKIGVYYMQYLEKKLRRKQIFYKETDLSYFELYLKFGGEILDISEKYSCGLLLLPQYPFNSDQIKSIDYKNIVMLGCFGYGANQLKELKELGGYKFWNYEEKVFREVVKAQKQEDIVNHFEVKEFALPYVKYPALDFSDLGIDYLIAYPTHVFLTDKRNEMNLFCNMRELLKSIPHEKTVYTKQHNVKDQGNRLSKPLSDNKYPYFVHLINLLVKIVIKKVFWRDSDWLRLLYNLKIDIAKHYIEQRTHSLSNKTKYFNLDIYHFLPFVREGVITGISTCQWNALYNRLPVFNCDSQKFDSALPNHHVVKNFYVPFCNQQLIFDENNYKKVKPPENKEDLIEMIKNEIQ